MTEDKPKVEDVIGEEFDEAKLRGLMLKWSKRDRSTVGDKRCDIPVREDKKGDAKWSVAYKHFENDMAIKLDNWMEWRDEHSSFRECQAIFKDFVDTSDEFRDVLEDQFNLLWLDEGEEETTDQEDDDGDDWYSDSFELAQMAEVGFIKEGKTVDYDKLKGGMLHFTRDVDEIVGYDEDWTNVQVREAWQRYMMDKFGNEWVTFSMKYTDRGILQEHIGWLVDNNEEFVENIEEKWVCRPEELEGNSGTSQESRETDSDSSPNSISDWSEKEGKAEESDFKVREPSGDDKQEIGSGPGNSSNGSGSGTIGEWAEKEGTTDDPGRRVSDDTGGGGSGETASTDTDSSGSGSGTLGEWAEKEGTVDKEESRITQSRDTGSISTVTKAEESIELERNHIYHDNTYKILEQLPDDCIDMVITSPPYYDLRDYAGDIDARIGGDPDCDHTRNKKDTCTKCGAWFGQLGKEPEPDMFIDHIVELFERIKRVLKPTGTAWLNLGDTYAKSDRSGRDNRYNIPQKSMMMVPERVALNMIDSGWAMRNRIVWAKIVMLSDETTAGFSNPCSFTDRFNYSDEPLFWFSQQSDYYFDLDAVRREHQSESQRTKSSEESGSKYREKDIDAESHGGMQARASRDDYELNYYHDKGANLPTTWQINPGSSENIHTAVFSRELVRRPIKAACPDQTCAKCGTPYFQGEKGCSCRTDETKPGIVLDPFTGRGTTLKEAAEQGLDYVGTEASDEYIELAREYVPNTKQQKLI